MRDARTLWPTPGDLSLAGFAATTLVAALDALLGTDLLLAGLVVVGPVVAALNSTALRTAAIGVYAAVLALVLGVSHGNFASREHLVAIGTVLVVSLLATGLAAARAQRERDSGRLAVQLAVARVLSEARSLEGVGRDLVQAIARPLRWTAGELWSVSGDGSLRCVASWQVPGTDLAGFVEDAERRVFRRGEGLPGRAVETGRPIFSIDLETDPGFPRVDLARAAGLRSATAFPVRTAEGMPAALVFFSREWRKPDDDLFALLDALSTEIGEFAVATRAVADLARARDQLDAILSGVADAVTAQAPDGTLMFANDAAVTQLGYGSREELFAAALRDMPERFELLTEAGEPFPWDQLPARRALVEGRPAEAVIRFLDRREREERWSVIKATPILNQQGEVVMAINVIEDVTGVKRAEQDQRLLAEASRVLGASLDREALIAQVAGLAVPEFADICELRMETAAVLETQRAELDRSAIVVPIVARGEGLGTISFGLSESGRRFTDRDLPVAEELGRRVGTALDNARLYAERDHIARTLQASLLPERLPAIPGIETAARFHATGDGTEVGGDFYDVFRSDAEWSVVVGDVCGKGPDAAAVTALARYTLRVAALRESVPSASLMLLNEELLRQRSDRRFATVAYARVTTDDGGASVGLASGGHPLPFVVRGGGAVERLGSPGTLLGVVDDPRIEDRRAHLDPGDAVVFYTDGVTEARGGDGEFGEERLARLLADAAGLSADEIAGRVESAALEVQNGDPRDDIAVLVLKATTPGGNSC